MHSKEETNTMHELTNFSYGLIFSASLYSSCVSCLSSYSSVLVFDFSIDLGRCVLAIGEQVRAPTAPFPVPLAFGKSLAAGPPPGRPVPSCLAKLETAFA